MAMRIGGLVSGIDTESIIKASLAPLQTRIDTEKQKYDIVEYKKQQYMSFNTKMITLRTNAMDLKLESTFKSKKATSSDETVLTATASSSARNGQYDVKVNSLATRVAMASSAALGSNADKTSIATQFGIASDAVISFTLQGSEGEVTLRRAAGSFTMDQIVEGINNADIGVTAYYDSGTDRFFIQSSEYGTEAKLSVKQDGISGTTTGFLMDTLKLGGTNAFTYTELNDPSGAPTQRKITSSEAIATTPPAGTATIASLYGTGETVPSNIYFKLEGALGSKSYTVASTTTLANLAATINADTATTGITAAYDSGTGKFSLTGAVGGTPGSALVAIRDDYTSSSDTEGFLGDKLKLCMDTVAGNGSEVEYNGTTLQFASNTFTIADVTYNLLNTSGAQVVHVNVTSDTQKALDKINAFIESYNAIVEYSNTKLNESKYKSSTDKYATFMPLTDAQKEDMTESQIELWDAKWQQGQMSNESLLKTTYTNLRLTTMDMLKDKVSADNITDPDDLVSTVAYKSLSAIGITTTEYEQGSKDNGKLQIDEDAFTAALEADSESVSKLFTLTQSQVVSGQTVTYNVGIGVRLYEQINDDISQIATKAGWANSSYDNSYMAKELVRIATRIGDYQEDYTDKENSLWAQFAQLEKAIADIQAQGNSLQAKLGGGSSS